MIVRNSSGREMLETALAQLSLSPLGSTGPSRRALVEQTVESDDAFLLPPPDKPPRTAAPMWLGKALAWIVSRTSPTGIEFGRYSIEYHAIRNYLHVLRHFPAAQAERHIPDFVRDIVKDYNDKGQIDKLLAKPTGSLTKKKK